MDTPHTPSSEPPSSNVNGDMSFPARAFGYSTRRYQEFLLALVEGLRIYELVIEGDRRHATTPLSAA